MYWGLALLVAGGLAAIISAAIDPANYAGNLDADNLARKAVFFYVAAGLLGLGLTLWAVGYVVRAIWFLPGRTETKTD